MLFFRKSPKFKLPKNFNPGAFPDRPDNRDRQYADVVMGAPQIDWEKGYNVEEELKIKLEIESQGGSSSCVGQAVGKYTEVINFVETGVLVNHSPKSVYEQIYLPQGGAYIRDGMKIPVKGGIALEERVPSYEYVQMDYGKVKNPPSEQFMRTQTIDPVIREEMKIYQAKEYRSIGPEDPDLLAHAIMNNHGAVSGARGDNKGWSKKDKDDFAVTPPSSKPWGHAFFFTGFGQNTRGKYFDFINSWSIQWGNNGRGRMYYDEYDMANNTFGAWTLVDKPNINKFMFRLIQEKDDPTRAVWWVGQDGKRRFFFNEVQFKEMAPAFGITNGFDSLEILSKEQINNIPIANPMVVIK